MKTQKTLLIMSTVTIGLVGVGYYFNSSQFSDQLDLSSKAKTHSSGRNQELGSPLVDQPTKESSVVFNDPAISQKWDLNKTDAPRAWQVSTGSREIVVAVIDTGADVDHEDLKENIWTNQGETGKDASGRNKSTNGIDDDNNGFIDDVHGWNFVNNSKDLTDNHGHGTHIAGIVGAMGGNNKGIIGLAPKVSMMILKYYDPKTPTDNLKNTILAIQYAVKMKAHIINYSGGGIEFSEHEKQAIEGARRRGILFVGAAGNERSNSDNHKYYPADYGLSNIISVTAIDPNTQVLSSSNYGVETVDIAAPGQNILSTLPKNAYGYMTGTSQATAFVTGAAAVVMAHKKSFAAEDVKKYLLGTGDSQASLINKTGTSRKLNLFKALTVLDSGIGVTGVQAANINKQTFTTDSNLPDPNSGTNELHRFGRSLLKAVGQPPVGNRND